MRRGFVPGFVNYNGIEKLQHKNTTQHIYDKQITDTQIHIHTIFTLQQEELNISQKNI